MSKNIVVCYDGTSAEYSKNNTNVVRIFESIVKDDTQAAFYDPGVGTFSFLGRKFGRWLGIVLGLVFGYGIRKNIEDGYEYLMNRFEPGDTVFLFGYSRGAYTARALAGMIHQFGILQKGSKNLIPYVSKMYFKKDGKKDFSVLRGFKETFSNVCEPHFIGLWDTVAALGPNLSKKFPDLKLNSDVKYGFQAVAIDEKRRPYKVVLWDESNKADNQIIEQVWFAGAHSEIGGGCSKGKCSLPKIAFSWMMDKASECGLRLKDSWQGGLNQDAGVDMHDSCSLPWVVLGLRKKREIPEKAIIHQSVIDRVNKRDDYNPTLPENKSIAITDSYSNNA
ncbi:DUF2235 domain-containing protein [Chloroflexota bacterium]